LLALSYTPPAAHLPTRFPIRPESLGVDSIVYHYHPLSTVAVSDVVLPSRL
jgi:hypothetical protein